MSGKLIYGKGINDVKLADVLLNLKTDIMKSLNCVKIGTIESFDGVKKTAKIQLVFKKVSIDGSITKYPVLYDCPVFTLQGGGGAIQFPIIKGDQCIVLFSDRNIDAWYQNGSQAVPYDSRAHDISDGIALVGINSLSVPVGSPVLQTYPTSETQISYANASIGLKGGKANIHNATKNLLTVLTALINAIENATYGGNALDVNTALEAVKTDLNALLY